MKAQAKKMNVESLKSGAESAESAEMKIAKVSSPKTRLDPVQCFPEKHINIRLFFNHFWITNHVQDESEKNYVFKCCTTTRSFLKNNHMFILFFTLQVCFDISKNNNSF